MKKIHKELMLSILVITYNHEKYIRQAMDGILMQKVDFEYEIIIGEDCSTDNTRGILLEYKEKYPDKIKLILHEQNIGMHNNINSVIRECFFGGKYIAVCEGDDYWVDPYKLKKQVDFLQKNNEYIGTAHKIKIVDQYGNLNNSIEIDSYCKDEIYTLEHVERNILPGQTATLVYRNILAKNPLDMKAFEECKSVGDRKTALYLAINGNIYCFNEVMSHYRKITDHGDSWSARNDHKNLNFFRFNQCKELSLFAYELKKIKMDYTEVYLKCGAEAFRIFIKKPSSENFKILSAIYTNYDNKKAMILHILKLCIKWLLKKIQVYFQS